MFNLKLLQLSLRSVHSLINEFINSLWSGLCAGNSPVTGEFPAQMASNAENIFIWWRHHLCDLSTGLTLYQVIEAFREYYEYPVNIQIDLSSAIPLEFPAVTFCNVNAAR